MLIKLIAYIAHSISKKYVLRLKIENGGTNRGQFGLIGNVSLGNS